MKRAVGIYAILMASTVVAGSADPVYIPDTNLKLAIEHQIGITHDPNEADMRTLLTYLGAQDKAIADLRGIETAGNLQSLYVGTNRISDLSPLSGLTNLQELDVSDNNVVSLDPLRNLTKLEFAELRGNAIVNISPLRNLTGLDFLDLGGNKITDVTPLGFLAGLAQLGLGRNQITDIGPLARLTSLTALLLADNPLGIEAYEKWIPQIKANNPTVYLEFDPLYTYTIGVMDFNEPNEFADRVRTNNSPGLALVEHVAVEGVMRMRNIGDSQARAKTRFGKTEAPTINVRLSYRWRDHPGTDPGCICL